MIDGNTGKAMADAFSFAFKVIGVTLAIFVPLGAWKAFELLSGLF